MKELLDDQWGIDTVYQDQYPSLLYATETGRVITAQPYLVTDGIMDQFKTNIMNGLSEVSCTFLIHQSTLSHCNVASHKGTQPHQTE